MDTGYHISLVKNSRSSGYRRSENDKELAKRAELLYEHVIPAIEEVVKTGNWKIYCKKIELYDRFVWEQSHKGDKSNIFAYAKIKIGPSWLEQLWAPVFERIRIRLVKIWGDAFPKISFELVLIQNQKKKVIESLLSTGHPDTKDVDGGIGVKVLFKNKEYILPIIIMEGKGGHFDKPLCRQVNNLFERFKATNQEVFCIGIHDNNISVGKESQVQSVAGSYDLMVIQRGENRKNEPYPSLNFQRFEEVERVCISYLKELSPTNFNQISLKESDGILLRDHLDTKGYYINPKFEKFL